MNPTAPKTIPLAEVLAKVTPRPWRIEITGGHESGTWYAALVSGTSQDQVRMADISAWLGAPEEGTANAILLAHAANVLPALVEALEGVLERIDANGEWDDGCFYYNGVSSSELEKPIKLARAALEAARNVPAP